MTVYLASYGVFRFLIEFLRYDDRGQLGKLLSPSQTMSLVFLGLAVLAFFLQRNYLKNKPAATAAAVNATVTANVSASEDKTQDNGGEQ